MYGLGLLATPLNNYAKTKLHYIFYLNLFKDYMYLDSIRKQNYNFITYNFNHSYIIFLAHEFNEIFDEIQKEIDKFICQHAPRSQRQLFEQNKTISHGN